MKNVLKLRLPIVSLSSSTYICIYRFLLRFVKIWHVECMRNCQNMFFWYQYSAKLKYMILWVNYFSRTHSQWIVGKWIILKFDFYINLPRKFVLCGILAIKNSRVWFRRWQNCSTITFCWFRRHGIWCGNHYQNEKIDMVVTYNKAKFNVWSEVIDVLLQLNAKLLGQLIS